MVIPSGDVFSDLLSILQSRKYYTIESVEMLGCRRAYYRKAENDLSDSTFLMRIIYVSITLTLILQPMDIYPIQVSKFHVNQDMKNLDYGNMKLASNIAKQSL